MQTERSVDVLVLGGGPAGSLAGALLARAGHETVLLEAQRSPHPAFGESLLPHTLPLLHDLGLRDVVRDLPSTRPAEGATFLTHDGDQRARYWFDEALAPPIPHGYNVRRDEFDAALLARARALGVEIFEGWTATLPLWENDRLVGAAVRDPDGTEYVVRSRVTLDASGRKAFLASRMGWRFPYPHHRRISVRSRFHGAPVISGREATATSVVLTRAGWTWLVPLAGDTVSVAAVLDSAVWREHAPSPDRLLHEAVDAAPAAARLLSGARQVGTPQLIQDFSHRVNHIAGNGFCLIGDAAGFLDPVFSTGVFLAAVTAASAAEDVIDAFARHRRVEGNDFAPTLVLTRSLHRLFFSFIRAFHDPSFLDLFLRESGRFGAHAPMISLLAGDVLRPGLWRRVARPRMLRASAKAQRVLGRSRRGSVASLSGPGPVT